MPDFCSPLPSPQYAVPGLGVLHHVEQKGAGGDQPDSERYNICQTNIRFKSPRCVQEGERQSNNSTSCCHLAARLAHHHAGAAAVAAVLDTSLLAFPAGPTAVATLDHPAL